VPNNIEKFEGPKVYLFFKFGNEVFPSGSIQVVDSKGIPKVLGWKGSLAETKGSH
jgi:hypothetical protein